MAMGRESDRQSDLMMTWAEIPSSPGHVFYDRLQEVLIAGGFDGFVETACQPYYAPKMGAPSVPPGRYFHMPFSAIRVAQRFSQPCFPFQYFCSECRDELPRPGTASV